MELSSSLRIRVELRALREQVNRMSEEHRSKKAAEFQVAYFAASMRIGNLEALNERGSRADSVLPAIG